MLLRLDMWQILVAGRWRLRIVTAFREIAGTIDRLFVTQCRSEKYVQLFLESLSPDVLAREVRQAIWRG